MDQDKIQELKDQMGSNQVDEEKVVEAEMTTIAVRNAEALALKSQLEEQLKPFSDGQPFDLARVTDCMYNAGGNEFIAKIIIGKGLMCAKAHLKHGEFIRWIEEELWFSPRTARRYLLLVTRIPKDKLLFFSRMGLRKTYALLEDASDEELKQLTEGEGMKGLSADRIDQMNASQLRTAFRRLKEKSRRQQDKIDRGEEQLEQLQRQLDAKVEIEKSYEHVLKEVFNRQLDVERHIAPMLSLFHREDASPKVKRAVWVLFNEIAARFAYEADLIAMEAGEAVAGLELEDSERRFQVNLAELEGIYMSGGMDIGVDPATVRAAQEAAYADMGVEDAEVLP